MNRSVVLGLGILLMAVVIGCSSKSEEDKLMEEMLANQEKLVDFMVKQDESSKAEMKKVAEKIAELGKKIEALPKEKQEELKKKWKSKLDAAEERAKKTMMDALKNMKPPTP
jgi:hypothetical protein